MSQRINKLITINYITMKYNWNEETVEHFKFESYYDVREKIEQRIKEFVEIDCIPEDGETEEDLVNDLINTVYE